MDLNDQVAIVTGGGAGIGRAIGVELAANGADVVIVDIDGARADEAAAAVQARGRRALRVVADVMESDAVRAAVVTADETFGRVDILVNNAGGVSGRPFLEQSERSWRRHIDLNLVSMLAATSAAAPVMIRGGRGGSIVNVASIEGTRAAPMYAVYAACKAGMLSFTRTMALELAEHAIRVNAIAPDLTITPGITGGGPVPEHLAEHAKGYIPLGRAGAAEECGRVAVFLCSAMASYVTGVTIPVDGGTWASAGWVRSPAGGWTLSG